MNLHITLHHADKPFYNGHAKAGPLDVLHALIVGALKGIIDMLQKSLIHSDAVILHNELKFTITAYVRRLLSDGNTDTSAVRGIFHRICYEIQQDLPDTAGVPLHIPVYDLICTYGKPMALFLCLMPDYSADITHQFLQANRFPGKDYFARLNPGHIQNFIEKLQKMLTGNTDLIQAVLYLLRIPRICLGYGGHPHNGIHRSPDVMGHSGKETGFGLIGSPG